MNFITYSSLKSGPRQSRPGKAFTSVGFALASTQGEVDANRI
jgi:hypothetical protein